jgi:hypothetical protein
MKLVKNVHRQKDIDKAVKDLPKEAKVLQVLPQSNIPSSIVIVYNLPEKKTQVRKPRTVNKPSIPKPEI